MFNHARHAVTAAAAAAVLSFASAQIAKAGGTVGPIFEVAMENHNWTQPSSLNSSINQIYGDPAAPFINSLVTPGNANAANVSYASNYYQPGNNEHPSEPNYLWAEAGTNFVPYTAGLSSSSTAVSTTKGTLQGTVIAGDPDPSSSANNQYPTSFAANHLTGQLNAAGVTWKNYQEDYQYSSSPLVSASGTGGTHNGNVVVANPYNGTTQYNYAVKHNPMAFFQDTQTQNVEQMSQLQTDLNNNTVGQYNWITPDQYNDMHSALNGGFTYHGTAYTGDQAMIAQGDNYLSIVVPEIEASYAFQHENGTIIIWNDETEGGDSTANTSMEIVISKLAKGNAYDSTVTMSHSSDVQTLENLYNLPYIDNPIPTSETFATGGYASVVGANDLSDLFVPGAITPSSAVPEPATLSLLGAGAVALLGRRRRNA